MTPCACFAISREVFRSLLLTRATADELQQRSASYGKLVLATLPFMHGLPEAAKQTVLEATEAGGNACVLYLRAVRQNSVFRRSRLQL